MLLLLRRGLGRLRLHRRPPEEMKEAIKSYPSRRRSNSSSSSSSSSSIWCSSREAQGG
jgi:hypothetical protein